VGHIGVGEWTGGMLFQGFVEKSRNNCIRIRDIANSEMSMSEESLKSQTRVYQSFGISGFGSWEEQVAWTSRSPKSR
jgi:hypothetical protein